MNGVMAVMAVVCVATVLGGELKVGPLSKLLTVARGAENKSTDMAPVDAVVVYDEDVVAQALAAINPGGFRPGALATDASAFSGADAVELGEPATAEVDHIVGSGGFRMGGGLATASSLAGDASTADQTPISNLSVPQSSAFLVPSSTLAPTPEPATWAMMVCGIGGIGLALRLARRRPATGERVWGDAQRG